MAVCCRYQLSMCLLLKTNDAFLSTSHVDTRTGFVLAFEIKICCCQVFDLTVYQVFDWYEIYDALVLVVEDKPFELHFAFANVFVTIWFWTDATCYVISWFLVSHFHCPRYLPFGIVQMYLRHSWITLSLSEYSTRRYEFSECRRRHRLVAHRACSSTKIWESTRVFALAWQRWLRDQYVLRVLNMLAMICKTDHYRKSPKMATLFSTFTNPTCGTVTTTRPKIIF